MGTILSAGWPLATSILHKAYVRLNQWTLRERPETTYRRWSFTGLIHLTLIHNVGVNWCRSPILIVC